MNQAEQIVANLLGETELAPGEKRSTMPEDYYKKHLRLIDAERRAKKKGDPAKHKAAAEKLSKHEQAFGEAEDILSAPPERLSIKVTFEDGNTVTTGFNGTLEDAQRYYVGRYFNFGDTDEHPKDKMVKAVRVEVIESVTEAEPEKINALGGYVNLAGNVVPADNALGGRKPKPKLDEFTAAYIEAALWSSSDESTPQGGEPMDSKYTVDDIDPKTLQQMAEDCKRFQEENAELLAQVPPGREWSAEAQSGHDFWLSRNGHGSGFWDRGYEGDLGDKLHEAAKAFGTFDLYVGDDGMIYGS